MADDGHADQRKITDAIQYFMSYKLIWKAQPFRVHDLIFGNDDDIVQGSAPGQAKPFEQFIFIQKTKCAGLADLVCKQVF